MDKLHFYVASPECSLPRVQATAVPRKAETSSVSLNAGYEGGKLFCSLGSFLLTAPPINTQHKVNGGCHPSPNRAPFSSADLVSPLVFRCSRVLSPESLGNPFSGLKVTRQNFSFQSEVYSVDRIVHEELSWDQTQTPPTRESRLLKTI